MLDELNLVLTCLGHAALGLDQLAQARRYLFEALQGAAEAGTLAPAIFSIALVALLLAHQGEAERAVELYALASRHPYVGNSRYREDTIGRHIVVAAATLPPEVAAGAQARGRARDLQATVAELLAELGDQGIMPPIGCSDPAPKSADKPGSVAGGHLSGTTVTRRL